MNDELDGFDRRLLDAVQRDDGRTADSLAEDIPLSPSAIARRLRRLRGEGWIERSIALLSSRLTRHRLRAVVFVQLAEHTNRQGKEQLERRLLSAHEVQFCFEIAGTYDLAMVIDCASMADLSQTTEELLAESPSVHRFEAHIVKREIKFAPFVSLATE